MARREYRDAKGRLRGYSEETPTYKWVPKWLALLFLAYMLYELIKDRM